MPTDHRPSAPTPRLDPAQKTAERILGEIAATKGQASKAAETSSEILAILTNGEANDPVLMIEALIRGIAEIGDTVRRMEARLMAIESRLDEHFSP